MHLVWHSVSPKRGRMIDLRDTDMPKYAGDNSTSPVQAPIPSSTRLGADQGPGLFVQRHPTDSNTRLFGDRRSSNAHSIRSRIKTRSKESGCIAAAISTDRRKDQ